MKDFVIRVEPVAWQRARSCGKRFFTAEKSMNFKQYVRGLLIRHRQEFVEYFNEAIFLEIKFVFNRPKSVKREHMTARPDLDNYLKAVMDAFNGIVYKDDSQIVKFTASKVYSEISNLEPGIHVKLKKMGE